MVKIFAPVLGGREMTGTHQNSDNGGEGTNGLLLEVGQSSESLIYHFVLKQVDTEDLPFLRVSVAF